MKIVEDKNTLEQQFILRLPAVSTTKKLRDCYGNNIDRQNMNEFECLINVVKIIYIYINTS